MGHDIRGLLGAVVASTGVKTAAAAPLTRRGNGPRIALAIAAALVAITAVWGSVLDGIVLHAAPLFAAWQPRIGIALLGPLAVAALVVWKGEDVAHRSSWRGVLGISFVSAAAWGVALALVDPEGMTGLTRGVSSPVDFLAGVDAVRSPASFLQTFTERIDDYTVHVRGHPPLLTVVLWWMQRIGLGGTAPFATMVIVAGALITPAVLVTVREVADERAARSIAPFLVLTPAAIWLVTSADAIYAGLGALGVAAVVMATGNEGRRSDAFAVMGGAALGIGLMMSYGLVLVLLVPFIVALSRRRLRPLVVAGIGGLGVVLVFVVFGFSWIEGLWATRAEYADSVAAMRPYTYFVLANLAALAIVLGPAPIAGLGRLRDRGLWLLAGSGLAVVVLADLSGLSKGEVERIWLPFLPWVTAAAASLTTRTRWWLAAQAGTAITVQSLFGTAW